ncbi:hypothetical protein AB6A23_13770 [Paenibacillus tarimensis]
MAYNEIKGVRAYGTIESKSGMDGTHCKLSIKWTDDGGMVCRASRDASSIEILAPQAVSSFQKKQSLRMDPVTPSSSVASSSSSGFVVRVGEVCIDARPEFDANLLRQIVQALERSC